MLLLQILATEFLQANVHNNNTPKYRVFDWDIPPWIAEAYKQIGVFGFGAACSQLITDIGKYSIGRLRPHFFSVSGEYITLFTSTIIFTNCKEKQLLKTLIILSGDFIAHKGIYVLHYSCNLPLSNIRHVYKENRYQEFNNNELINGCCRIKFIVHDTLNRWQLSIDLIKNLLVIFLI